MRGLMIDPLPASPALTDAQGPDAAYWNRFYGAAAAPEDPSAFARFVGDALAQPDFLIDVGCGNGRDSAYFAGLGWTVRGFDASAAAVARCQGRIAALGLAHQAAFVEGAVDDPVTWSGLATPAGAPLIYARFLLHAIDVPSEAGLLDQLAQMLQQRGGTFAAEFRTPADEALAKEAQPHYRRYVDPDALCAKLERRGLRIVYRVEGQGMAVHKSEDAHVARIFAAP